MSLSRGGFHSLLHCYERDWLMIQTVGKLDSCSYEDQGKLPPHQVIPKSQILCPYCVSTAAWQTEGTDV